MPHAAEPWTPDRVRALPDDGNRYELVDGELLVTPAPSLHHQVAVGLLHEALNFWLKQSRLGFAVTAPSDISLDPHTLVQPDICVVPLVGGRRPQEWSDVSSLLLAVEVLSPSTARQDRQRKRSYYQQAGVPEYWIVDPDARVIERWRPGDARPEVLGEQLDWIPPDAGTGLTIDLARFFADVWDEG